MKVSVFARLNLKIPLDSRRRDRKTEPDRGNEGKFIVEAIPEIISPLSKREQLAKLMKEGYLARSEEAAELAREFEPLDMEGLGAD